MNIALEKTEEWVNGQKRRTYGDAFVRGNNGTQKQPAPLPFLPNPPHQLTFPALRAVMYISADS